MTNEWTQLLANASLTLTDNSQATQRKPTKNANMMAMRGSDLFLCTGQPGFLHACPLAHLKKTCMTDTNDLSVFCKLRCLSIEFEPRQLVTSANGTLMAVVGARRVAVVVLPSTTQLKAAMKADTLVDSKTLNVGDFHHGTDEFHEVVKVLWHPHRASVLCVLSSDGCLRVYDLMESILDPVTQVQFCEFTASGAYADDVNAFEAAAFCFGAGEADACVVYTVMRNGDMYSCVIEDDLSIEAAVGPYLVMPRPVEVGQSDDIVSDISCLSCGTDNGGMQVLAVSYSHGKVELFLPDLRAQLTSTADDYDENDEDDVSYEMILFETVDLALSRQSSQMKIHVDDYKSGTFFLFHDFGVHSINVNSWVENLVDKLSDTQTDAALTSTLTSMITIDTAGLQLWSQVDNVLNSLSYSISQQLSLVGMVMVSDVFLDNVMMVMTSALSLVFTELSVQAIIEIESSSTVAETNVKSLVSNASIDSHGTAINSLLREIPIQQALPFIELKNGKLVIGAVIPDRGRTPTVSSSKTVSKQKYPEFKITKDLLTHISQIANQYRGDIMTLLQLSNSVRTRLDLFDAEWSRICTLLKTYVGPQSEEASKNMTTLKERTETAMNNQSRLMKRVDLLLQISMESDSPALSKAEKQWSQELTSLQMSGLNELRAKISKMQNQMTMMHQQYEIDLSSQDNQQQAATGMHQIHEQIINSSQFIDDLREKVERLELKIEQLE